MIRRRKSKKDRKHNGQKKNDKRQIIIYQTLHRKLMREQPLIPEDGLRFSRKVSSSFSTCGIRRVILVANPV